MAITTRFEDMIDDPLLFVQAVSREVGINPTQHETTLTGWANRVQNTNNQQFVEAKTSRAYSRSDHTVKVDRWRENLSESEVAQIAPIIQATARRLRYAIPQ